MEHARKMVLVPEDDVKKLKSTSPMANDVSISVQTNGTKLSRLDDEMVQLLNSQDLNDRDKWTRYQQIQQRYLNFRNGGPNFAAGKSSAAAPVGEKSDENRRGVSKETIIMSVPHTFKKKTELLLQIFDSPHIEQRIAWDRRGEVTIDGKTLIRSNIVDLVNDCIRFRRHIQALGREQFSWFLRDIGVPTEIFGNHKLYKIGGEYNISNSSSLNNNRSSRVSFSTSNTSAKSRSFLKKKLSFRDDDDGEGDNSQLDSTVVAMKKSSSSQNNQTGHGWLSIA